MAIPTAPDLDAYFRRYAQLLLAGDAETIADYAAPPLMAIRGGQVIHLADRPAVVEHVSGLIRGLLEAGAAQGEILDIEAIGQGDAALLAIVHWQVRRADGTPIQDFRTSYQLVGDGEWRIVSYVNHDMLRGP